MFEVDAIGALQIGRVGDEELALDLDPCTYFPFAARLNSTLRPETLAAMYNGVVDHLVASMRLRRSSSCSSGTSNVNSRISVSVASGLTRSMVFTFL